MVQKNKTLYSNFVNSFIKKGKIKQAKLIVDSTFLTLSKKYNISSNNLVIRIFKKLRIFIETKKVRIKRRTYVIPFPVGLNRRRYLVLTWIRSALREDRRRISISEKLVTELTGLFSRNANSKALKHLSLNSSQAVSSRSNVHYRW